MRFLKVLALLISILILVMSLSQFFTNIPPIGVVVTLFRLPYQYLVQWIFPIAIVSIFIMIVGALRGRILFGMVDKMICAVLILIVILSVLYIFRIKSATAQMHCMIYKSEDIENGEKSLSYKVMDESENAKMKQLFIYMPENSQADVCVIHINYGGWSIQYKDTGMYFEKLCEQQGYSFVQLAGIGKEDGDIIDIVKSVREGISFVQKKYGFKKTYLIGSSAGGHLALVSAFAGSIPEMYGDEKIDIDGVIALYAPVDLEYQYKYFVEEYTAKDMLGRLGDGLYCKLFNGTSGTLGGETAKIQEAFLGEYSSDNNLYQISKLGNLISDYKIPILFIQGEKDSQIGLGDKSMLYEYLDRRGYPYTVLNLPGVDHAYDMVFPEKTPAGKRSMEEIKRWIGNLEKADKK